MKKIFFFFLSLYFFSLSISFQKKEMPFADGGFPTQDIIKEFIQLCHAVFAKSTPEKEESIGVHCVAGLGR